jgi:hypothetical protein
MKLNEMFPSKWWHADDLPKAGKDVTVTAVEKEEVGLDRVMKNILAFKGEEKRLILNVTKARRLYEILAGPNGEGSDSNNWIGKRIKMVPASIRIGAETKKTILIDPAGKLPTLKRKPEPSELEGEGEIDFQ